MKKKILKTKTSKADARNRHLYPTVDFIEAQTHHDKKQNKFQEGTCFDTVITEKLN